MTAAQLKADEFLKSAAKYQLGFLPTEQSHPVTKNLSDWCLNEPQQAITALTQVDLAALKKMLEYLPQIEELKTVIQQTLDEGHKIYLCGCGATGRLSLSLEYLWRERFFGKPIEDSVRSFMAGGDVALVHSLEGFEDFPEYGAEQLIQAGFQDGDLLISTTEGGETPFVIGATHEAAKVSARAPYFIYCNPTELLAENIQRSNEVIADPNIKKICLFVGSMSLAGSTRMQASTVLMLGVGIAMMAINQTVDLRDILSRWIRHYENLNFAALENFIVEEARLYQSGASTIYIPSDWAITVFTDTTERAPTFSMPAFDNQLFPKKEASLTYVMLADTRSQSESFKKLLGREPRSLNWRDRNFKTSDDYLKGFDFSAQALPFRTQLWQGVAPVPFHIDILKDRIVWRLGKNRAEFPRFNEWPLLDHLMLKMLLNIHSTCLMGRMRRFEGNFMTWVSPSNGKLVDRATRYILLLCERRGMAVPSYEVAVRAMFEQLETIKEKESVVVKTVEALSGGQS